MPAAWNVRPHKLFQREVLRSLIAKDGPLDVRSQVGQLNARSNDPVGHAFRGSDLRDGHATTKCMTPLACLVKGKLQVWIGLDFQRTDHQPLPMQPLLKTGKFNAQGGFVRGKSLCESRISALA